MKKLLLFLLFSGSLDSFSQAQLKDSVYRVISPADMATINTSGAPTYHSNGAAWQLPATTDTIHAELLLTYTTRRWGVAHSRDGYVVRKGAEVVEYLDNNHKPFPMCVTIWGWVKWEERKIKK